MPKALPFWQQAKKAAVLEQITPLVSISHIKGLILNTCTSLNMSSLKPVSKVFFVIVKWYKSAIYGIQPVITVSRMQVIT